MPCQLALLSFTERFRQALGTLCTETPPLEMCRAWLESDDELLQSWVLDHARIAWAQGIGLIDAARCIADQCEEGRPELISHGEELLLRALKLHGPLPLVRRKYGWKLVRPIPGASAADVFNVLHNQHAQVDGKRNLVLNCDLANSL